MTDIKNTPSYAAFTAAKNTYQASPTKANALAYAQAANVCLKEAKASWRVPVAL